MQAMPAFRQRSAISESKFRTADRRRRAFSESHRDCDDIRREIFFRDGKEI